MAQLARPMRSALQAKPETQNGAELTLDAARIRKQFNYARARADLPAGFLFEAAATTALIGALPFLAALPLLPLLDETATDLPMPAASLSLAMCGVFSQVNSGNSRPK